MYLCCVKQLAIKTIRFFFHVDIVVLVSELVVLASLSECMVIPVPTTLGTSLKVCIRVASFSQKLTLTTIG